VYALHVGGADACMSELLTYALHVSIPQHTSAYLSTSDMPVSEVTYALHVRGESSASYRQHARY
jgi:hypothetical protein